MLYFFHQRTFFLSFFIHCMTPSSNYFENQGPTRKMKDMVLFILLLDSLKKKTGSCFTTESMLLSHFVWIKNMIKIPYRICVARLVRFVLFLFSSLSFKSWDTHLEKSNNSVVLGFCSKSQDTDCWFSWLVTLSASLFISMSFMEMDSHNTCSPCSICCSL